MNSITRNLGIAVAVTIGATAGIAAENLTGRWAATTVQQGVTRASKTIHNIKGAWIKEQQVVVDNGKVTLYRVDLKVTFVLD